MMGSFAARLAPILALLIIDANVAAGAAAASSAPPKPHPRQSADALRTLVRQLTAEAQEARHEGFLRHPQPDAAQRFDAAIAEADLQKALTERQHRDPLIDGYIRWQLTSFDIELPFMTPQAFRRLMEHAPAMVENPRASPRMLDLFGRAADAGPLPPADLGQLREVNRELDRQTQMAEALNVPAIEFREWVAGQLGASRSEDRRLLWMLEDCAATIVAGWPPRQIKTRITQSFSASAKDDTITDADRRAIAAQAQRLAGLERRLVNEVTFMADGSVRVTYSTAAVASRDVENWIARLAGDDPG